MEDPATPNLQSVETSASAPSEVVLISYQDRLKSILEDPAFPDEIFKHVANGGDLITLCQGKDIRYSDLASWCWKSPEIGKMLFQAGEVRKEWVRARVLMEMSHIAMADLRQAFTPEGAMKAPKDWPEGLARALAGVETDELFEHGDDGRKFVGYTKKIKLHGKIEALKLIGQQFGLFVQKHEVEVKKSLEDLVAGSFEDEPIVAPVIANAEPQTSHAEVKP